MWKSWRCIVICRDSVVISKDFPISIKYAEVAADQACPTPIIGDVQASLKREILARCNQGECEQVACVPESPNVLSILRQLGQFSNVVGDRRECYVSIMAEANTRCICEGTTPPEAPDPPHDPAEPEDPHAPEEPDDPRPPTGGGQGDGGEGSRCCFSVAAGAFAYAAASAYAAVTAIASARATVLISILIAIAVFVAAIATALAFASVIAVALAIAVAIAVAIAIAIAIAIARTLVPRGRCIELIDVPPHYALSNPQRPAVLWNTMDLTPGAGFPVPDHVDVLQSTDGGNSFAVVGIEPGRTADTLPLSGAFIWLDIANFSPGTLVLVYAAAFDAANNELCRSQLRSIRIVA
jgi:hypothetical protein